MSNENEDLLFTVEDPRGYPISLTSERYYEHITNSEGNHQAHNEFTPEEMAMVVEDPVVIYASDRPNIDVYFGKSSSLYPHLYLKVAVEMYSDGGNVTSAFLTKHISGGIKEGGLKYANYYSKLR